MSEPKKKLSIPDLKDRKTRKEKTTLVAVGDFLMAQWAERGGVDIVGVGNPGYGQALNGADLIGAFDDFKPKFSKRYGNVGEVAVNAFSEFVKEVKEGQFPDADHSYSMPHEEAQKLQAALSGKHSR